MARSHLTANTSILPGLLSISAALLSASAAISADDLKLRPGVSLTQDIDSGFPITGTNLDDVKIQQGTPTIIFFGASGDLNTNRQAKRFVALYKKVAAQKMKFLVIDIDHPANEDAKSLIKSHYKGYIPLEVVLDKTGKKIWSHDGELELNQLKVQVDKALD